MHSNNLRSRNRDAIMKDSKSSKPNKSGSKKVAKFKINQSKSLN